MKTFQRPSFALAFQGDDQILAELHQNDVLLLKSVLTNDELRQVSVFHPSQRNWIPLAEHPELGTADFNFQRNVKAPQPRLPGPTPPTLPTPGSVPLARVATPRPSLPGQTPGKTSGQAGLPGGPGSASKPTLMPKKPAPPTVGGAAAAAGTLAPTSMKMPGAPAQPSSSMASSAAAQPPSASPAATPVREPILKPLSAHPVNHPQEFQGQDVSSANLKVLVAKNSEFLSKLVRVSFPHIQAAQPWPGVVGQKMSIIIRHGEENYKLEGTIDPRYPKRDVVELSASLELQYLKDLLFVLGIL